MSVRQRLRRLEKEVQHAGPGYVARDFAAEMQAIRSYLDGIGPPPPEPPCPSWDDPEEHFRRYRTSLCFLMRGKGDLGEGEYLPGMSDHERRCVDGWIHALEVSTRSVQDWPPEANLSVA
jgi:hypothetical protein